MNTLKLICAALLGGLIFALGDDLFKELIAVTLLITIVAADKLQTKAARRQ